MIFVHKKHYYELEGSLSEGQRFDLYQLLYCGLMARDDHSERCKELGERLMAALYKGGEDEKRKVDSGSSCACGDAKPCASSESQHITGVGPDYDPTLAEFIVKHPGPPWDDIKHGYPPAAAGVEPAGGDVGSDDKPAAIKFPVWDAADAELMVPIPTNHPNPGLRGNDPDKKSSGGRCGLFASDEERDAFNDWFKRLRTNPTEAGND